jgi:hypothetical protein
MKKMIFFMLTFMVLGAASMNAQVLIGSGLGTEDLPTQGTILDLQSGGSLGLLLPSVTLTSSTVWAPVGGTAVEGMTVFNNSDALVNELTGKGIYVWVNGAWSRTGAVATPCVDIEASATTASFTGEGSAQTLEVNVNKGTGPFNYSWYLDGNLLQDHSNVLERSDSYTTGAYGNYICKVSNACNLVNVSFSVLDIDEGEYTATENQPSGTDIKWNLQGVTCFDVREGKGFADSGESSTVELVVTGATVTNVVWQYTNLSAVLNGTQTEANTGITIPFKNRSVISDAATSPITVQVKALITMTTASPAKTYKVVKTIDLKFQNKSCCEGYLAVGGEYSTDMTGHLNIGAGTTFAQLTSATGIWKFAPTGKDLCFYKTDAVNGSTTTFNWSVANSTTNGCAASEYFVPSADRDVSWRMPNIAELGAIHSIRNALGQLTTSVPGTTNMSQQHYWSSDTYNASQGQYWHMTSNFVQSSEKINPSGIRCVRTVE